MSANRLRALLVALFAIAAVVSALGRRGSHTWVDAISVAFFALAVVTFGLWRRKELAERRARVFDREAKTGETGPRSDR